MTFDNWMDKVDEFMEILCGLNSECIEDYCYRDEYDAGASPKEVALRALKNANYDTTVNYIR